MLRDGWAMILAALLCLTTFTYASPTARACNAKYITHDGHNPNDYIVVLKDGYSLADHQKTIGISFPATTWSQGYWAILTPSQLNAVRGDCSVVYVEDDLLGDDDWDDEDIGDAKKLKRGSQKEANAPWGLATVSTAKSSTPRDTDYWYLDNAGKGVTVYVIDSGINHGPATGVEFLDPSNANVNRVRDTIQYTDDNTPNDQSAKGHGTGVASIVGGQKYGIAKFVTIENVKARRNGKPHGGSILSALKDIRARHAAAKSDPNFKGSVINMSFKIGFEQAISNELDRCDADGISLVASAGNKGYVPNKFPSSHPKVISVGAVNVDWKPWTPKKAGGDSSNYGAGNVNIWAPGQDVKLVTIQGGERTGSGTSFAAPHVSGILAILYSVKGWQNLSPTQARDLLFKQCNDWVDLSTPPPGAPDWKNSPKSLANSGNRKGAALNPPLQFIDGPNALGTTSTPSGVQPHVCNGINNKKFVSYDTLNTLIPQFCAVAAKQGVHDKDSGSIMRPYTLNGESVNLAIDWPQGGNFKPDENECKTRLYTVTNSCDGNNPNNPLNWKHGGYQIVDVARYSITPVGDRWNAGICSLHVHQKEWQDGFNTPGFQATFTYAITADIKDGTGATVGSSPKDTPAGKDGGNPYIYNGPGLMPNPDLHILPEAQGGDYIAFNYGTVAKWASTDTDQSKLPRCSVGAWDHSDSWLGFTGGPRGRDMDCSFQC